MFIYQTHSNILTTIHTRQEFKHAILEYAASLLSLHPFTRNVFSRETVPTMAQCCLQTQHVLIASTSQHFSITCKCNFYATNIPDAFEQVTNLFWKAFAFDSTNKPQQIGETIYIHNHRVWAQKK